jgi:3-oxoacyl-[acyl-carrier-protein] synthase III
LKFIDYKTKRSFAGLPLRRLEMWQIQLHADVAVNAMADAGLKPADIDGFATVGETPVTITHSSASPPNGSTVPRPAAARS